MAVESLLRPGEEDWKGAFDNLLTRFSQFDAATVAETLRANGGHAGRTATQLRKTPVPDKVTASQTVAPVAVKVQACPSPAKAPPSPKRPQKAAAAPAVPAPAKAEAYPQAKPAEAEGFRMPKPADVVVAPAQAKADPQVPPPDSKLLFVAALQGDLQGLTDLIEAGADLNGRYTGRPNREKADKIIDATPLHLVVTMGKTDVAEVLLKHGADFEAKMRRALGSGKPAEEQYAEMTALHLAAMEGHTNIVDMLLRQGASKKAKMQLIECKGDRTEERAITPLEIAQEMASKGYSRDAVISLLSR